MRQCCTLVCLALLWAGVSLQAAEPTNTLKTVMTERGKELFADPLGKTLNTEWKVAKGKWEIVNGALKGVEVKDDNHAAVIRHDVAFQNGIIQVSFKLENVKQASLSLNGAKAHIGRLVLRPDGFTVQKDDQDGKNGPDKVAILETIETPLKAGEWHTLVLELQGKEILAKIDDKHIAYGQHDALDKEKANLGFTLAGEHVEFKDLRIWAATPAKSWATDKAKLLSTRTNVKAAKP